MRPESQVTLMRPGVRQAIKKGGLSLLFIKQLTNYLVVLSYLFGQHRVYSVIYTSTTVVRVYPVGDR